MAAPSARATGTGVHNMELEEDVETVSRRLWSSIVRWNTDVRRKDYYFTLPCEVYEGLFLGHGAHAQNVVMLQTLNISCVVNCAESVVRTGAGFYPRGWEYLGIDAMDADEYPIIERHFKEVLEFHKRSRLANRKVLIHCFAGMNRSAALVVGIMMLHHGQSLVEATRQCTMQRGVILANDGFRRQLIWLAKAEGRIGQEDWPEEMTRRSTT